MRFFTQTLRRLLSLTLLVSLVSGCGFQLRGNYLIAPELKTLTVLSKDRHGELARVIRQHLKVNDVNVLTGIDENTPILRVERDSLNRRTLSLFENGQVAEYELILTVKYSLQFPNEEPVPYNFELYRDYQDDPDRALAKSRELSMILAELRQQAADRVLRNLATLSR